LKLSSDGFVAELSFALELPVGSFAKVEAISLHLVLHTESRVEVDVEKSSNLAGVDFHFNLLSLLFILPKF
jgi:hypothetical protein